MLTHNGGVLPPPSRPIASHGVDPLGHRARLRRELLKRIIDREIRRRSFRNGAR
jgi:hypothetical protein